MLILKDLEGTSSPSTEMQTSRGGQPGSWQASSATWMIASVSSAKSSEVVPSQAEGREDDTHSCTCEEVGPEEEEAGWLGNDIMQGGQGGVWVI